MYLEDFAELSADVHDDVHLNLSENLGEPTQEDLDSEVEVKHTQFPECVPMDDALKHYLRKIQNSKFLSPDEEIELATRFAKGDRSARDAMVEANLCLVVSIAKRYERFGLPFLDLISEGNLGLIKAVEHFDTAKACRLSTYATWWIRQAIVRSLANHSRTVRLPVHISCDLNKVTKATRELRNTLNCEPSEKEISAKLGVSIPRIRQLKSFSNWAVSTEKPLGIDDYHTLGDTLEDSSTASPEEFAGNLDSFELFTECFACLSDTEKMILTLRFGLNDNEPQTLESIGRNLGLTRERVRQIEVKILGKLRKLIEGIQGVIDCGEFLDAQI